MIDGGAIVGDTMRPIGRVIFIAMTKYPLPTPQMFAVHHRVVSITQLAWAMSEISQSMSKLQQTLGDVVLPALKRFAEELEKIDSETLDDEQE